MDAVNKPEHYQGGNGIECIDAIEAALGSDGFMAYCRGNIIKYLFRWEKKGGIEDLNKASVYLSWLNERALTKEREAEILDEMVERSERDGGSTRLTDLEILTYLNAVHNGED